MSSFLIQHQISLIAFLGLLLLIALSNLRNLRRLDEYRQLSAYPRVSILVPARNEESTIGPCVRTLLSQRYPNFQVLVLDDESSDGTWRVLETLAAKDNRLRVLKGKPLPSGWLGKHWACHQLGQAADGELLLFTDADTHHQPDTLSYSVAALLAEEADLVSAMPKEKAVSWAERLLIPILLWSIFSFLPLCLAYRLKTPFLSAAMGQLMLFRREAYEQIGGYESVRQHAVDDLALGRRIKSHGLCWRLLDGSRHIHCRMYQNFNEIYEGLSKNLFAVFEYNVPIFVFIWLWLLIVFWEPLVVLALGMTQPYISSLSMVLAAVAIAASLLLWGISYQRFGFPLYMVFFYPLSMLLAVVVAMSSMVLTLAGRTGWKGRRIPSRY